MSEVGILHFVHDIIAFFNVVDHVLIAQSEDCTNLNWVPVVSSALLCYSSDEEITTVVNHVEVLMNHDVLQLVFFFGTADYDRLISKLDQNTNIFNSKVITVVPNTWKTNLTLQLNSQLVLYEQAEMGFNLYEIYAIKNGPTIQHQIGTWNMDCGISIKIHNMWKRRSDLLGLNLRCTTVPYPVLTILSYDVSGQLTGSTGYYQEILHYLERKLNFTAIVNLSTDGKFGGLNKDGKTWNGMVGMLMRGETDLITASLTHTYDRNKVVEYAVPLERDVATLVSPSVKGQATNVWVYMDIFPNRAWFVCGLMLLLISAGFVIIEKTGMNNFHRFSDSESFTMLNSAALSALLLFQLSYNVLIKSKSAMILLLLSSLATYIIFSYYTCDLTARMTSGPPDVPIRSFQDVLDRKYEVVVLDGSSNQMFLKTSHEGSAMHKLYYTAMEGNPNAQVQSNEEGKESALTRDKTLLFTSALTILGDERFIPLRLTDAIYGHSGWAFKKNSQFTDFFNYHLSQMAEDGVKSILRKRWLFRPTAEFGVSEAISLGYDNTLFPFCMVVAGIIFSVIIILCEHITKSYLPISIPTLPI
jgi:ABC-type amino acid transport substrate-binding protein